MTVLWEKNIIFSKYIVIIKILNFKYDVVQRAEIQMLLFQLLTACHVPSAYTK